MKLQNEKSKICLVMLYFKEYSTAMMKPKMQDPRQYELQQN